MKFELNLLQNSHDYINNSFDLYKIADEYGMHDDQRAVFENKVKWKLAFVTMVQAFELLLKEVLYHVHPNLIYTSIDSENITEKNTITFQQAIIRINNFIDNPIENDEKMFLINCSKIRNEFNHYKVNIQSEQIKSKYCKLYSIYSKLHSRFIGESIKFYNERHKNTEHEILLYDDKWTVFRGREFREDELEEFKKEIEKNKLYKYYVNKNGKKIERIRYGDEISYIGEEYSSKYEICDDCNAKKSEYHLEGCDMEICPFCFGQVLSCGCVKSIES